MSEHARPVVKPADDPAFQLPASLSAISFPLLIGGVLILLGGWALGTFGVDAKIGMSAYLTAFMYCLTLATGCLFFVLIQHLVRAGWSTVVRRIAELFMVMVIPMAVLFIPILASVFLGEGILYRWDDPTYAEANFLPLNSWGEKSKWLNQNWFFVRAVIYFVVWAALAIYYFRGSVNQDETGQRVVTDRMQYWAGPATMAFCGVTSFAAFDWVMSLAPFWFSTMFGVYMFAGSVLAAHCLICISAFTLQKAGAMRDEVTVEHYHDLGKLIFGFTFFWTYISFSQYLLIWYGNIPEETEWFYHRQEGNWLYVSIALIFFHWMLPFAGTMLRHVRRRPWAMACWAVYLLVMHYVDVFWMIMPEAHAALPGSAPSVVNAMGVGASVLCVVGMLMLMVGLVLRVAQHTRVVAVRDPRLLESMAFENI